MYNSKSIQPITGAAMRSPCRRKGFERNAKGVKPHELCYGSFNNHVSYTIKTADNCVWPSSVSSTSSIDNLPHSGHMIFFSKCGRSLSIGKVILPTSESKYLLHFLHLKWSSVIFHSSPLFPFQDGSGLPYQHQFQGVSPVIILSLIQWGHDR